MMRSRRWTGSFLAASYFSYHMQLQYVLCTCMSTGVALEVRELVPGQPPPLRIYNSFEECLSGIKVHFRESAAELCRSKEMEVET